MGETGQDFFSIGKRFSPWIHSVLLSGERKSAFPVHPFRAIRIRATVSSSEEISAVSFDVALGGTVFFWVSEN